MCVRHLCLAESKCSLRVCSVYSYHNVPGTELRAGQRDEENTAGP